MAVDKKPKQKRSSGYHLCPYCEGVRQFTSQWYVNEHIKVCHPEKRKSLIGE